VNRKDTAGYYALLCVSETASAVEIKTAFRQRAKELHPDQNSSHDAVRQFQQVNEAYEVLSNPDTRARYDTLYAQIPQSESVSYQWVDLEPITCSCCSKVTAQPRYVIFYQVTSFIVVTIRSPIQGVFCPTCAERKALQSTIVTWLMGWWGLPWGVFYSLTTIFHNLFGGSKPNDVNARLLTYQAWVFATQNKFDIARAVAADANDLARKIKKNEGTQLQNLTGELLSALDTKTPIKRLKNVWSVLNRSFYLQSGILGAVAALAIGFFSHVPTETASIASSSQTASSTSPSLSPKPQYIRPTTADNGVPFLAISSYINGYSARLTDGYSTVTVDNSQNDSDVFVKLFTLDTNPPKPARVFFIRARETFTVKNVKAGNYDVRYHDLDSGGFSRTDQFNLEEIKTVGGIQFSKTILTLYKVRGGNMQTHIISENEF
jgi:hypothetical protein